MKPSRFRNSRTLIPADFLMHENENPVFITDSGGTIMTESEIRKLLERQRTFFSTGKTLPVSFRLRQLEKLKRSIQKNEPLLRHALKKDLGKSNMESYMCEIGLTLSELSWMQRHVRSLAKNRTVPTPLSQFAAHSYRSPIPYGTVLIMSPWNYPLLLTLEPLIDAIAAGNTVILKPSAYAPASLAMIKEIIETTFPADYISVIEGGRTENQALLRQKFDKIFFTGSKAVRKGSSAACRRESDPCYIGTGWKKSLYR